MRLFALLLLLASAPAWAQLYAYKNAEGRLIITDRPVEKEKSDYKLVDTYKPPKFNNSQRATQERTSHDVVKGQRRLNRSQMEALVNPVARSLKVDPNLVMAVIEIESSRNSRALSNKGAMGLMQLMPATAERFGVKNAWDPMQNIKGGVLYLRYLLSYFEGDVDLVLAGYNAGENAVDRHKGVPPYKETKRYIEKIRRIYSETNIPYDPAVAKRKSALVAKIDVVAASAPALKVVAE